jgi:cysteine sulfinate desulfinase/cysteine desulfurase-like protein
MDLDPALIDGSIRVSLSFDTTKEDIQGFVTGLRQAVDQLT